MLGRDRVLGILDKALGYSGADQIHAAIGIGQSSLTRFANNIIHQNVSERNAHLAVKAVIGKHLGLAYTNRLDDESIKAVVTKAVEFARHSPENPDFVSLPGPSPIAEAATCDERTAEYSPEDRARAVSGMIAEAKKVGGSAAGQLSTAYEEFASANSLGVRAYYPSTGANLSTVVTADSGYGYADRVAHRIDDFSPLEAGIEAATRSARSRNPESIEPGEYDVILLPYAVTEFLEFMSWLGFSALAVQEGRSFMSGKLGEKVTGENITIWDDGLNPLGIPRPCDMEGVPKERVDLIVNGVAKSPVYDSYTAHKEGKRSTGHAVSLSGADGPMATNMFLEPGTHSLEEMIASVEKGVLVTRFHYTNVIHPILMLITGMTRDGTFLIENGKITKPLKNMRFTDCILERLSNVDMIGKDTMRQSMCVVPAIKARGFKFTGSTEF
jgi:PmbA protein